MTGALAAALSADGLLGEPPRLHPLIGFGAFAVAIERRCNADAGVAGTRAAPCMPARLAGVFALLGLVLPCIALAALAAALPRAGFAADILVLYFCIGHRSLREHAQRVQRALQAHDLPTARVQLAAIVSRDTQDMNATRVAAATVESVLENGNDAVFGVLFWFAVAGAPAALAYRLVNTLDAMWGYRTPRYARFGWAAARLDDALNYLPARLTAIGYALLGRTVSALRCWRTQAPGCESPNAGPVMAAGAGSLGLRLGGGAHYHGAWKDRPALGEGRAAGAEDIARALRLVAMSLLLWLLAFGVFDVLRELAAHA